MIAAILTIALAGAQEFNYDVDGDANDCQNNAPIAGTAGWRNAQAAISTNAQTFGAAQFAERNIFPQLAAGDSESAGAGALEESFIFGAARVPSMELGYPFMGCPTDLRISTRALDLGAASFGLGGRYKRVGFFYAASMAYSGTAFHNPFTRSMLTMGYLMYGIVGAAFAPLVQVDESQGLATYVTDYIVGLNVDAEVADVNVGYVGSRGFYSEIEEKRAGLFLATLFQDNFSALPYLRGGLSGLDTAAGLSSLYVRKLPFTSLAGTDVDGTRGESTGASEEFLTSHVKQRDLFGFLDLEAAYAFRPTPLLHEAQVGFHNPDYHSGAEQRALAGARGADHRDQRAPLQHVGQQRHLSRPPEEAPRVPLRERLQVTIRRSIPHGGSTARLVQRGQDRASVGGALGGGFAQQISDQADEGVGRGLLAGGRLLATVVHALEGLVEDHPQRPEVGGGGGRLEAVLLWRHVGGRAPTTTSLAQEGGDAEVEHLDQAVGLEEDVAGLEVTLPVKKLEHVPFRS